MDSGQLGECLHIERLCLILIKLPVTGIRWSNVFKSHGLETELGCKSRIFPQRPFKAVCCDLYCCEK